MTNGSPTSVMNIFWQHVAALLLPDTYPLKVRRICVRPTHMAMVFLTEHHAWKLRRPLQQGAMDFRLRTSRLSDTLSEYELDDHFAPGVCLGLSFLQPDASSASGWTLKQMGLQSFVNRAETSESGEPVLCMHRLPASGMLNQRILSGSFKPSEGQRCVAMLARRLADRRACDITPQWLIDREISQSVANLSSLGRLSGERSSPLLIELEQRLRSSLAHHRTQIAQRARGGQVKDGHGDLRPEHVCVAGAWATRHGPAFIDALEFSQELRIRDTLSEIAGLAVECEFLGSASAHQQLRQAWRGIDPLASDGLWHHYAGQHALMRALHAAWHLDSPCTVTQAETWRRKSADWLQQARIQFCGSMSVT